MIQKVYNSENKSLKIEKLFIEDSILEYDNDFVNLSF